MLKKSKKNNFHFPSPPHVTFIIAAYNEEDYIADKIENTLSLNYPSENLQLIVVSDGSTDRTPDIARGYKQVKVLHKPERLGKIAAVEHAMAYADHDFVVFSDANTFVNTNGLQRIVSHFANPAVGAVAGEKRIMTGSAESASGAGESLYWKYESKLKEWDSKLYSVVGAAGELFAVRKAVYEPVPEDTIIEDFYLTLRIAQKGYRVIYEPRAYALETPSASSKEELKRKVRIAAGGLQAIGRLSELLNPFRYGTLSFQYISHRVLRWTVAPVLLVLLIPVNAALASQGYMFYQITMMAQTIFYLTAAFGWLLESYKIRLKLFFIPFYFTMMNYAVFAGFFRLIRGRQSVLWEKAQRSRLSS